MSMYIRMSGIKNGIKNGGQMKRFERLGRTAEYARYSGYDTKEEEDEFLSLLGPVWCDGDPVPADDLLPDKHEVRARALK